MEINGTASFIFDGLEPSEKNAFIELAKRLKEDPVEGAPDDPFMPYRFLKARQFNIEKAEKLLRQHLTYRRLLRLDQDDFIDNYVIPVIDKYFTRGDFGYDRQGRPVVYFPFGCIDPKGLLHSVKASDTLKAILAWQERSRRLCQESYRRTGRPVYQSLYVLDLKGINHKHMWRPGLEIFSQIASCLEEHAPESVYKMYIVNAPGIFNAFYQIIKPVLDENTKKKIKIYGGDFHSALLEDIEPELLPAYYGGLCRSDDGDEKCAHLISYGGPVPMELYFKDDIRPVELSEITVNSRSDALIPLYIRHTQATLSWYVKSTTERDIGFSIYYTNDEKVESVSEMEMLVPYFRIITAFVPEHGQMRINRPGKYVMHLNNKYSYFFGKRLEYSFTVLPDA